MNTFMIIDDDISIVKMLSNIIKKNQLGKVVEELDSSEHAVEEILLYHPDILLIDYLMFPKDGALIIKEVQEKGYQGKIIMISQVEDTAMVTEAYNNGIEFFIKKPINAIEVIKVIKNVIHNIELERSLSMIKSALSGVEQSRPQKSQEETTVRSILTDLGIIAQSGTTDLMQVIEKVRKYKLRNPNSPYKLYTIYEEILKKDSQSNDDVVEKDIKAFEQRIRRTIQKALENIAQLGIEDYYNPKFTEYASVLFDLKQVNQEMKHIEDSDEDKGRMNIKKFIEGIISKINIEGQ